MRLSEVHIFIAYKLFFSVEKISKHYFMIIFAQSRKKKKHDFRSKSWINPFEKYAKLRLSVVHIFKG